MSYLSLKDKITCVLSWQDQGAGELHWQDQGVQGEGQAQQAADLPRWQHPRGLCLAGPVDVLNVCQISFNNMFSKHCCLLACLLVLAHGCPLFIHSSTCT